LTIRSFHDFVLAKMIGIAIPTVPLDYYNDYSSRDVLHCRAVYLLVPIIPENNTSSFDIIVGHRLVIPRSQALLLKPLMNVKVWYVATKK
jgi:hypothetical protein